LEAIGLTTTEVRQLTLPSFVKGLSWSRRYSSQPCCWNEMLSLRLMYHYIRNVRKY